VGEGGSYPELERLRIGTKRNRLIAQASVRRLRSDYFRVSRVGGSPSAADSGSSLSSATGTRYFSDAHAPRSITLQRSEQNGRHGLCGAHSTLRPQLGQATSWGMDQSGSELRASSFENIWPAARSS
jgi:hypothetical protein